MKNDVTEQISSASNQQISSAPEALFLDRDGTLIFDKDYLHEPEKVELIPGVPEALKTAKNAGGKLFVVTNQSGSGRGFITFEEYEKCHKKFLELLGVPADFFDACCIAPEAPEMPSKYRKPSPAFILEQLEAFPEISPKNCFMVGDRLSDWECGLNAKIRAAAVETGKPFDEKSRLWLSKNRVETFPNFAKFVEKFF